MTQAARILGKLPPDPIYAILDGARDKRIRNWVMDTRAASWCLYRGDLPASIENAAPWLLRLVPGQPYVEQFFARGWNQSWGTLLACAAGLGPRASNASGQAAHLGDMRLGSLAAGPADGALVLLLHGFPQTGTCWLDALNTLAELFPTRWVVPIYSGDLVWGLGTMHCMTQQQPAQGK